VRKRPYLTIAICVGVTLWMLACGKAASDPKVIHADGESYIACGGVLSFHSPRDKYETDPGTDEVFFQDPLGTKHHLSNVRSLTITDFVGDAPECKAAR
jgi:hypothetical protein